MTHFTYQLPSERIAQRPVYPYDHAKLMVIDRKSASLQVDTFTNIARYLEVSDLLVFNNSKVIPARLLGQLQPSGAEVELLLVKKINAHSESNEIWTALGKPLKKLTEQKTIKFGADFSAKIINRIADKFIQIELQASSGSVEQQLQKHGLMPIPPYIRKGQADNTDVSDYQSNFAKLAGSIAAPTASLHFTPELLASLRSNGYKFAELTLHVGTASFLPLYQEEQELAELSNDETSSKTPGTESFYVSSEIYQALQAQKKSKHKTVAVGTTVTRALESLEQLPEFTTDTFLDTDIFIKPGYQFSYVDALVTNFHQPGTTHMLLVEALLGYQLLEKAYHYALDHDFRFLSYGDGMLIL